MTQFVDALDQLLKLEGGHSNHPRDLGGNTQFGITQAVYDTYRANLGLPKQNVVNILFVQVKDIYRALYWDKCSIDKLPAKLRYIVFDCAVNQGVSAAIRLLQKAVGAKIDGVIGEKTLQAINTAPVVETVLEYAKLRSSRYFTTRTFETFGKGWLNRLLEATVFTLGVK